AQVQDNAAVAGNRVHRLVELRATVAATRTEHVTGQTLAVDTNEGDRVGCFYRDSDMLAAVNEAAEARQGCTHVGGTGVGHPLESDRYLGTDGGRGNGGACGGAGHCVSP